MINILIPIVTMHKHIKKILQNISTNASHPLSLLVGYFLNLSIKIAAIPAATSITTINTTIK